MHKTLDTVQGVNQPQMHKFEQVILNCAFRICHLCILKPTCAFSNWSCALYQNYSAFLRRSKVRFAPFFLKEKHTPASLLLLFRKRSRQVAWLVCKRTRCRLVAYQPFSGCAYGASTSKPYNSEIKGLEP